MNLAPIVLFVYNRPEHARQAIEALRKNDLAAESDLFIFSDGPKKQENLDAVREVRDYIHTIDGFRSVTIVERETNFGLARSIITGVTQVVKKYGRVIVLEADNVVHPRFLSYMNSALERYQGVDDVYAVTGYSYTTGNDEIDEYYFLRISSSWSWGTWKDKWEVFDPQATGWEQLDTDRSFRRSFNFDNSQDYAKMLKMQMQGKSDSWAIRWYWSIFRKQGLTLFPKNSLVRNIGFDGSGAHCSVTGNDAPFSNFVSTVDLPDTVCEKEYIRNVVAAALTKKFNLTIFGKVLTKARRLLRQLVN